MFAEDLHPPLPRQGEDPGRHICLERDVKNRRRLLPAAVIARAGAAPDGITVVTAEAATSTRMSPMHDVVSAKVPLSVSEAGRVHVFRPEDGGEEHYVVELGARVDAPLVRLHSACFTGDVLGSLKCDCGPQLRGALGAMGEEGAGVLLYLNQEGRGIFYVLS